MHAYADKKLTQRSTSANGRSVTASGIPSQMKKGFETFSGFSFDDVKVHYNSDKPSQLKARAYTQGSEVYVGPGQEQSVPHELGHVVQQKRGEVTPNTQLNGQPLNTEPDMERGADTIAQSVLQQEPVQADGLAESEAVVQRAYGEGFYNVSTGIGAIGAVLGGITALGMSYHKSRKHSKLADAKSAALGGNLTKVNAELTKANTAKDEAEGKVTEAEAAVDVAGAKTAAREAAKQKTIAARSAQITANYARRAEETLDKAKNEESYNKMRAQADQIMEKSEDTQYAADLATQSAEQAAASVKEKQEVRP